MTSLIKRLAKTSAYNIVGVVIGGLLALLTNIIIARYLGKEILGMYAFAFTFVSFFAIIANLGIDNIVTRESSKYPKKISLYVTNALILKTMLAMIVMLICGIIILFLNYPSNMKLGIFFAIFSIVLSAYVQTFNGIFQIRLETIYSALGNIASKILFLLLICFVIFIKGGFIMIIIAALSSLFLNIILLYSPVIKRIKFTKFNSKIIRYLLLESWPIALSSVFAMIFYRIDVLMLQVFKTSSEIGLYSVAYSFGEAFTWIGGAYIAAIYPVLSNFYKNNRPALNKIYYLSFKYIIVFTAPFSLVSTVFSKQIITFFYGNQFADSAFAFAILMWAAIFIFLGYLINAMLEVSMNQKKVAAIYFVTAVFNILINLYAIPRYSYIGAAWTSLISYAFAVLAGLLFLRKIVTFRLSVLFRIIITLIVALILLLLIKNLFLSLIIMCIIYIVLLFVLRIINDEDFILLKTVLETKGKDQEKSFIN